MHALAQVSNLAHPLRELLRRFPRPSHGHIGMMSSPVLFLPKLYQHLSQHEAHRSPCDRHGRSCQLNDSSILNTGQHGSWHSNHAGILLSSTYCPMVLCLCENTVSLSCTVLRATLSSLRTKLFFLPNLKRWVSYSTLAGSGRNRTPCSPRHSARL